MSPYFSNQEAILHAAEPPLAPPSISCTSRLPLTSPQTSRVPTGCSAQASISETLPQKRQQSRGCIPRTPATGGDLYFSWRNFIIFSDFILLD